MKKILKYLVLFVAMLSVLCACGGEKLTATTSWAVTDKLKELGIYVEEEVYNNTMPSGAQRVGGITTNAWAYSFCDFKDDDEGCDKMFDGYMDMIVDEVDSETNGSNYTIVEGKADGDYILISRVDNTILQVWASDSYKEDIRTFAKDLGYYK